MTCICNAILLSYNTIESQDIMAAIVMFIIISLLGKVFKDKFNNPKMG